MNALPAKYLRRKARVSELYDLGLCRDHCGRRREGESSRCRTCLDKKVRISREWRRRRSAAKQLTLTQP